MIMMSVDNKDRKIIEILKKDSRTSFVDIAKQLNLSEGAVRKRIRKLINSGIIKRFTIEISEPSVKALILISSTPAIPNPKIAQEIRNIKGVEWVYEVTGQFDIAVLVSGPDIAYLNKVIDEVRSLNGITHTNTLIVLRQH
ncbi:MAG: Lrp/AsnC family transcriptional regulator [Candidatus Methanomethylicia archaeon]